MPRILLADDHAVVRKGLRQILAEEIPEAEFWEAGTGLEVLDLFRLGVWDLVLLDINIPGLNGLEILKKIRKLRRATPVLMLSLYPESEYGVRSLRLGASGYVSKQDPPDKLAEAVRKVMAGGKYISSTLAEKLALEVGPRGGEIPHEALSDREFQVLRLFGSGMTATQIGEHLALSPKTVATYRARILEKMKLTTTAQIVKYAIEHAMT